MIATCFALASFAAAVVAGMAAGNRTETILVSATVVMVLGWFVGFVIGLIAQRTIDAHIEQYRKDHPLPADPLNPAPDTRQPIAGETA